jgi:hypothetical protein
MTRPEAVRRVKTYSSTESGYVYQYYFYEVQKARRGIVEGTEYVYMVSRDRKKVFPVRVFLRRDAAEKWSAKTGRALSGTEEYAVAKLRLFDAFDELDDLEGRPADLEVDETKLNSLLGRLDI